MAVSVTGPTANLGSPVRPGRGMYSDLYKRKQLSQNHMYNTKTCMGHNTLD